MLSGIEATTAKAQFKKNAKEWAELEHGKKAPSLSEDFIDIVSKVWISFYFWSLLPLC